MDIIMSSEESKSILRALSLDSQRFRVTRCTNQSGGCINICRTYTVEDTDSVPREIKNYFVKSNRDMRERARGIFEAEAYCLKLIADTRTVRVPQVHFAGNLRTDDDYSAAIIMEYVDMSSSLSQAAQRNLGRQLAEMHLHSAHRLGESEFGLAVDNYCGSTPQINTHRSANWIEFFRQYRLQYQLDLPSAKRYPRLQEGASRLLPKIERFFEELSDPIQPALIHGDLWGGNAGSLRSDPSTPVLFDPAPYFAHSEMELSIMGMFGGFTDDFYREYHRLIPQQPGFKIRQQLYQLYHYLNHLNLFGSGYLGHCLDIVEYLLEHVE